MLGIPFLVYSDDAWYCVLCEGVGMGVLISFVSDMVLPERKRVVKVGNSSSPNNADGYMVEVVAGTGVSAEVSYLSQMAVVICVFSVAIFNRYNKFKYGVIAWNDKLVVGMMPWTSPRLGG
jgi:hypothetical protein